MTIDELLELTDKDVTLELIRTLFAGSHSGNAQYKTTDPIKVNLKKYKLYFQTPPDLKDEVINTTIGRYIFNTFMTEKDDPYFYDLLGYENEPLTNKNIERINEEFADAF